MGFIDSEAIWSGGDSQVFGLNCATAKIDWQSKGANVVDVSGLKLSPDGFLIAICSAAGFECFGRDGSKKWEFRVDDRRPVINGPNCDFPQQSSIGKEVLGYDDTTKNMFALDMATGKELWRVPISGPAALLEASPAGDAMIMSGQNGPFVLDPLAGTQKRLDVAPRSDNFFSPDGTLVISIPTLDTVARDQTNRTFTVARKSHECEILDSSTGRLVRRVLLKKD
jgi:outer membrane protein assembly factor BamB